MISVAAAVFVEAAGLLFGSAEVAVVPVEVVTSATGVAVVSTCVTVDAATESEVSAVRTTWKVCKIKRWKPQQQPRSLVRSLLSEREENKRQKNVTVTTNLSRCFLQLQTCRHPRIDVVVNL